jgi:ParB-like chromosome segregation protein Spo0J
MSVDGVDSDSIVKEVPLGKLVPPEYDVRSDRDIDELRSLAQSMSEDGQLQPALTHVDELANGTEDLDVDEIPLDELMQHVDTIRVVDGWSRKEAAEMLEWPTLRCEVYRDPPAEAELASLAANTERLEMRSFDTMKTLKDLVERTDMPIKVLAERTGYHPSTLSSYLGVFDGFEPALEAWRDPDTHVELGHVVEINRSPNEEVAQKVFRDCIDYERSVGYTRTVRERAVEDWQKQRDDERTMEERQHDGEVEAAEKEARKAAQAEQDEKRCILTGKPAPTSIAVPVSPEARGLLTRLRESGQCLADVEDGPAGPAEPDA